MKKIFTISATAGIFLITAVSVARAAIQYGSTSLQSGYAATTTSQVNSLINNVVTGQLGATSTSDVNGIVQGTENRLGDANNWLVDRAGINLMGILKAIGHFLVSIIGFVIDLIKKLL